jgi:hypothetical protein
MTTSVSSLFTTIMGAVLPLLLELILQMMGI